jgi:hypothetical protein
MKSFNASDLIFEFCTATFRELGPPDLCHVVKSTGRSGQRDVRGSYVQISHANTSLYSSALITISLALMHRLPRLWLHT